ncbi:Uncharacterised protein [Moraxella ovis]|uniref:MotA/TolQ/ExbB proton channel domain-containing protein n=1 Tax=Moraxella ovis TaxID=29433 RepID=A0A378PJ41_9GAMM|nr:MotA/TolQ/ExbB proton channel family protein [Moraxella ovis]STY86447.1 Uncharacterised protein [Moraxella ovis]
MSLFIGMFSGLNLIFTIIITSVFCLSVYWLQKNKQTKFVKQAPTLLTSLGIFGTFFGIVIALLGFDGVDNIKEQIDIIISGMQTAFITSVEGLLLSIILKVLIIFKKDDANQSDATGEQLIQSFIQQTENSSQSVEKLTLLINAIGQDGDNSLIGQIRLMRSDFNDYQKHNKEFEIKLWQEMDKVTETLAKSATETIIEALKDVIHDFNENLTEQFGENFKELNRAVFELVTWQENYRQQIQAMTEQYALGVQAINNTKEAVIKIEDSTKFIPDYMRGLGIIINDNQNQLNELAKHLQTFADIRQQAVESLPKIQEHIKSVLDNMQNGSQNIQIATREMQQNLTNWVSNFEHLIQKAQQDLQTSLMNITSEQKEFIRVQMRDLTKSAQKSYSDMQKDINEILKETQKNMATTQEKTISDMATSLVNITRQFANDYASLTEQMNRVIRQNGGFR